MNELDILMLDMIGVQQAMIFGSVEGWTHGAIHAALCREGLLQEIIGYAFYLEECDLVDSVLPELKLKAVWDPKCSSPRCKILAGVESL